MSKEVYELLNNNYEKISHQQRFPYGQRRGDIETLTVYKMINEGLIPNEDIALLKARDAESRRGPMAALSGIYNTMVSEDNKRFIIKYYRHTAG